MNDEIKVRRYTNFNNDVYEYGPIGEEALCKHLIESNKHYINVSKLTEFQTYDVDIIQINDNNIQSELYSSKAWVVGLNPTCGTKIYKKNKKNVLYVDLLFFLIKIYIEKFGY